MGSFINASCQCGLEVGIMLGGGFRNFTTVAYFPCICEKCRNVVQANMFSKRKRCPRCRGRVTPYDDPALSVLDGSERIIEDWNVEDTIGRILVLTDGGYRCPQCDQMTLHFRGAGCWD
jgi:Zn finger protein HypA/HybF involved in hydrogenase expression